eukprot:UN25937
MPSFRPNSHAPTAAPTDKPSRINSDWSVGAYPNCSTKCGAEYQVLPTVTCVNQDNNEIIDDSKCVFETRPIPFPRTCEAVECRWESSDYPSECHSTCGPAITQTRNVGCINQNNQTVEPVSKCIANQKWRTV